MKKQRGTDTTYYGTFRAQKISPKNINSKTQTITFSAKAEAIKLASYLLQWASDEKESRPLIITTHRGQKNDNGFSSSVLTESKKLKK